MCDGLQTVFLVNREGVLADLLDIRAWSGKWDERQLPAPSCALYRPHTLATLHGGHVCLVLTPNQEIKIFAAGTMIFRYSDARWRLLDIPSKFAAWREAVGLATPPEHRVFDQRPKSAAASSCRVRRRSGTPRRH